MQAPRITVFPRREIKGLESVADIARVDPAPHMPIDEAMGTSFNYDAHFCQYLILDRDGQPNDSQYRVNKSCVPSIEALGGSVRLFVFALDIDNPNHGPWTPELVEQFEERVARLPDDLKPSWIMRTRGGARFVYHLAEPILPADAEDRYRGLVKLLASYGFDEKSMLECSDWTRFFRLPMVLRDGKPSTSDPFFFLGFEPNAQPLDWHRLEAIPRPFKDGRPDVTGIDDPSRDPPPTPEEARLLLHNIDNTETAWWKKAKPFLSGRGHDDMIFNAIPPTQGSRDNTLMSVCGLISRMIYDIDGTPDHVYAILLPAVEQMVPDREHPSWPATLWRQVGYTWRGVVASEPPRARSNAEYHPDLDPPKVGERVSIQAARGMQAWCSHPAIADPASDVSQTFVRRLAAICVNNKHFHVLRPTGYYDPNAVTIEHLRNELIRNGWGDEFKLDIETKDGSRPVTQSELLAQLMVQHVHGVEGFAGRQGDSVRGIDSDRLILDRALFKLRTDLVPEFSPEVDEWMTQIAGEDQIEALRRWIGYALDFTEPICMLALRGTNGLGKSFLMLGLADCLASPAPVLDGMGLMSEFAEELLYTPFIEIAEALPVNGFSTKARDRLRQMIGGAGVLVNRKGRSKVFAHTFLRVAITTNNDQPIRQMADDESSRDDVKAIMQRTLVLNLRDEGAAWLESRGGKDYTRRWVSNGGMQDSDFTLAKHFLWLYQQRDQWPRGKRLLVEGTGYGKGDHETEDTLQNSDALLEVAQAVSEMMNQHDLTALRGVSIEKEPSVTAQAISDWLSRPGKRTMLTPRKIALQMKNLSTRKDGNHIRLCTNGEKSEKQRWWVLDLERLLHLAQEYGWPTRFQAARCALKETE